MCDNISTVTALVKIKKCVDINNLINYLNDNGLTCRTKQQQNMLLLNDLKNTNFKNQFSCNYFYMDKKEKRVNIKIFRNGTLHFTGCNSLKKIKEILYDINVLYENASIDKIDVESAFDELQIVMINRTICTSYKFNQRRFKDLLISKYDILATFDPKIYAGINAKYIENNKKLASFLIFASGKIIISGAKSILDLNKATNKIMNIINVDIENFKLEN